jgi:hypothetical protein
MPSLNPKQQTDLVNNFPEQMSSLAIFPLLRYVEMATTKNTLSITLGYIFL